MTRVGGAWSAWSARAISVAALAVISGGCGYGPVRGAVDAAGTPGELAVIGGPASVPSAAAIAAVEAGARAELARAGRLASCSPREGSGCSAVLVEILRVEEESAGIALGRVDPTGGPGDPRGRGVRVTVTGRARLLANGPDRQEGQGGAGQGTGEVRASEVVSSGGDAVRFSSTREDAVRLAAMRLGERLARRILGLPDPSDEGGWK